jgi:hypothetical protein
MFEIWKSESMNEDTSMRVKKTTKKRFNSYGARGVKDDALLNRLLNEVDEYRKVKKSEV